MVGETAPEYRLRLFLSVDLVGSTAYKSKDGTTNLEWIKAFQKFYGEFPNLLAKHYKTVCAETPEIQTEELESFPKVWKTIGDEILFVNRVNSITHLGAYVRAFTATLIEFGREVQISFSLNTKGNAWIAAFPNPNRSIRLSVNGSDPLLGDKDVLTEEFEAAVDKKPSDYDFLGKGIDGGFRISRNSSIESLTVSPALAFLLCEAKRNHDTTKFDCRFEFHEPQFFKGVVQDQKYPVISLITSRDEGLDKLQNFEAKLLGRPREADFDTLFKYLESYIDHHKIEKPELRLTAKEVPVDPPEHYKSYIVEWKKDLESIRAAKVFEEGAADADAPQIPATPVETASAEASLKAALTLFLEAAAARQKRKEDPKPEKPPNE